MPEVVKTLSMVMNGTELTLEVTQKMLEEVTKTYGEASPENIKLFIAEALKSALAKL